MLSEEKAKEVEQILKLSLRRKFQDYNPEPAVMPFHTRLLGKDRLALYSFIHSLSTNFGTTIFEPVAISLAKGKFKRASSQVTAGTKISALAQTEIQKIMDGLETAASNPNKTEETAMIRSVCQKGNILETRPTKVDVLLESYSGELFLIDIKTVKPNIGAFKEFKRTLLEWVAVVLAERPEIKVNTLIAMPYNPYEPSPYNRWTMRGMLDLDKELKVAGEFWDFLGGEGAYEELLKCFERVGIEMREEIDNYFSNYNK